MMEFDQNVFRNMIQKHSYFTDYECINYIQHQTNIEEQLKECMLQFIFNDRAIIFNWAVDTYGIEIFKDSTYHDNLIHDAAYYGCYGIVKRALDYVDILDISLKRLDIAAYISHCRCHEDSSKLIYDYIKTKNRLNKIDKILNRDV